MEALLRAERAHSAPAACITEVGQFLAFPAECTERFLGWTLAPAVPVGGVVLYVACKPLLAKACEALGTDGSSATFTLFCFLHNVALCLFSLVVCVRSVSILLGALARDGLRTTYCGAPAGSTLMADGFAFYVMLFYLSKFYEFMDTFILIVKRKKVMLLQSYHHSGAVIAMWALVPTQSHGAMFFVCMNSFVHTAMYAYYAASVYKEGSLATAALYRLLLPLKPYLTRMQILQFIIGLFGAAPMHFIAGCNTLAANAATAFSQAYAMPLIALFAAFYLDAYRKQSTKTL